MFFIRDIAQLGRAPALGAGCRRFKSYYPDLLISPRFLERIKLIKDSKELLIEFNLFFILPSCNYKLLTVYNVTILSIINLILTQNY